jgi:NADH:ubiquinone oxidoreductase subunit H
MHLFFFSMVVSTLFLGGWELPNFFFTIITGAYNNFELLNN